MTKPTPPYLADIHAVLPRVFGLFDANPISALCGVGDRYRWAWKGIDFANGTFQGAVHGLALLLRHGLLPEGIAQAAVLARIDAMINAIPAIRHGNGSLDEILPMESSYCVTALVAFDVLCALDVLGPLLPEQTRARHLRTLAPLIGFLVRSREAHGIITNHLAVAVAALTRWQRVTGENVQAARDEVLKVLLSHRSPEGWFREYDGADPGYQTLALDYLSDVAAQAPGLRLEPLLAQCCDFLLHAAHPDGSFGGLYGSRNTRFLYPAGLEQLAQHSPAAAALAQFAREAHAARSVVGLAAMDDANLIPMFTSFCRAAVGAAQAHMAPATLPCLAPQPFQRHFPEAGWIVTRGDGWYNITHTRKAVLCHYAPDKAVQDGGVLARDSHGTWYSSQTAGAATRLVSATPEQIVLDAPLLRYHVAYPAAWQMVVLRVLCLTVMRFAALNARIKRLLVWLLISRRPAAKGRVRRTIRLAEALQVDDQWLDNPHGLMLQQAPVTFQAIHMASQGYWQAGDDR